MSNQTKLTRLKAEMDAAWDAACDAACDAAREARIQRFFEIVGRG